MPGLVNPFLFEDLLSPISPEIFFKNYWEKKPLLIKDKQRQGYKNLISSKDVDFLVTSHPFPAHYTDTYWIRFLRTNAVREDLTEYLNLETKLISRSKMIAGYRNGNTINLARLHHRWEPVRRLCQNLEEVFSYHAGADLLLSPPGVQTFRAHYDVENVFLIQLEGKKRWKLYGRDTKYPLKGRNFPPNAPELDELTEDFIIEAGDLLYLPRGWIHEVSGVKDDYSMHLIVEVGVHDWSNVLIELIKEEPLFRKALPMHSLGQKPLNVVDKECLQHLSKILVNKEKVERAYKKVQAMFSQVKKHHLSESFAHLASTPPIQANTILKKKEPLFYTFVADGENRITTLHFEDDGIRFPTHLEPFLQDMMKREKFSIKDLPHTLSTKEKKLLVNTLLNAGVLELA